MFYNFLLHIQNVQQLPLPTDAKNLIFGYIITNYQAEQLKIPTQLPLW